MFIPGLLQAEGVRRAGAQRAAIGSTIGPPTTIFLAAHIPQRAPERMAAPRQRMMVGSVLMLSWPKRVVADEP